MIIDFHSHIMPAFDDGAKDAKMSIAMLQKSMDQGVETVVSTSHCYPMSGRDITEFTDKRQTAYNVLMEAVKADNAEIPKLVPAAEVHLSCDIASLKGIEQLCIGDTRYMLVEMPSSLWTDEVIDRVYKLSISGIKPIIAHMERNIVQKDELLSALYMLDILVQVNAESFAMPVYKKFIGKMMKNKLIHIVGTDMHNLTTRPPDMEKAHKAIIKRFGSDCWEYLMQNAETVLTEGELSYRRLRSFSPKGIFMGNLFAK
ncbi:MAG: hypothetical protein IJH37_08185 [Clostridia bacterium]|nr:hypothetical protein [Clostridia bacterium]